MNKIGYLVKEARIHSGLTQNEAVERLNKIGVRITQSKISRIESGTYKMPTDWLVPFAKVYNINPLQLLLTKEEMSKLDY